MEQLPPDFKKSLIAWEEFREYDSKKFMVETGLFIIRNQYYLILFVNSF